MDVAGDSPALRDGTRQHGELITDQDDVGDPLGDLASGAHSHRESRLLQRRDVVDAVPDHRREAPAIGERADQRLLLLRRDPAEDRVLLGREPDPGRVVWQIRPVDHAGVAGHAHGAGHSGHGLACVAGDQLQVDALSPHELDRLNSVGAKLLLQHDQGARVEPGRRLAPGIGGERRRRLSEGDDAPPGGGVLLQGALKHGRQLERPGLGEHVGRPQNVAAGRSPAVQGDTAPLPLRGERHLGDHALGLAGVALGNRLQGPVPLPGGVGEAAERLVRVSRLPLVGHLHRDQVQGAVGERSRLVYADRVHGGERLGCSDLLHEGVHPRQADGRDGKGDAHQQHQALRDQRHEAGGRGLSRLVERHVADRERDQQEHCERHHHDRGRAQHAVDLDLKWRGWMAERPGFARHLLRVAVAANGIHLVVARAREAEGAREQPIAIALADSLGLTGEDRLVQHQATRGDDHAVGDELVAGLDPDQIAGDDLLGAQLDRLAVAHGHRPRRDQECELVERLLGLQLLANPDRRVDHRDEPEQGIGEQSQRQHEDEEGAQDGIEEGEDVAGDDARDGAAAGRLRHPQAVQPPGRLGAGQPRRVRLLAHS